MFRLKTQKLLYGKYLYKVVVRTALANIFRTELQTRGQLSHARSELDKLRDLRDRNLPMQMQKWRAVVPVKHSEWLDARRIYMVLKSQEDYTVRINPYNLVSVYTNNEKLIDTLERVAEYTYETSKPESQEIETLLTQKNVIITDTIPKFPLRVIINSNTKPNSDFALWLKTNTDKSKIGVKALAAIENGWFSGGFYFYVRDEKVLNMIYLLIGSSIRRVEKLVYSGNLDK